MNTLLYIGLGFITLGFLLFVVSEIMIAHYDRKLWELKERKKSGEREVGILAMVLRRLTLHPTELPALRQ